MKKKTKPQEPKELVLSREDLLRCELAQAKTESAINANAAQKLRVESMKRDWEAKIHSAEIQHASLVSHMTACVRDSEALWAEMGTKYGVDFKRVSYDSETGVIHVLPDEGGKGAV